MNVNRIFTVMETCSISCSLLLVYVIFREANGLYILVSVINFLERLSLANLGSEPATSIPIVHLVTCKLM